MGINQKLLKSILLSSLVLWTIPAFATMYEDAEDNAITGWEIYGDTTNATIENVADMQRGSRVIKLTGNGKRTGYSLGNRSGRASYVGAWHNRTEKMLKWSMKYTEPFRIYIPITTEHGNRYLTYTNQSVDAKGKIRGGKVNYGLGLDSTDGTWHTFARDLEADWNAFMPNDHFVSVNGFFIKGSGYIDDLMSINESNPNLPKVDTTKPVITLLGNTPVTLNVDDTYTDAGATAIDDVDGNITANIQVTGLPIDTSSEGNYTVTYSVSDIAGNVADVVTRTIIISHDILTKEEPLVPANCLGHITKSGVDTNGNGLLDEYEVISTKEHYDEGTPITREALITMIGNGDDVTQVNTCKITDMSHLFDGSDWNSLYTEAQKKIIQNFNQNINEWNTKSVKNMSYMFQVAKAFNQPLDNWDVSSVTSMRGMFLAGYEKADFNQPLDSWDVSNVTDMGEMFLGTSAFNQPLDSWDVSNVTNMADMFYSAKAFNQPLNSWDVSSVTNMSSMFDFTGVFNQPLDNWDVSNVTKMTGMFFMANVFNQDISKWNISNVSDHYKFAEQSALENAHNPFYRRSN